MPVAVSVIHMSLRWQKNDISVCVTMRRTRVDYFINNSVHYDDENGDIEECAAKHTQRDSSQVADGVSLGPFSNGTYFHVRGFKCWFDVR